MKRTTGSYIQIQTGDEGFRSFIPAPLPPAPPLRLTANITISSSAPTERSGVSMV